MLTRFALFLISALIVAAPCSAQSANVDSLMMFAGNIHQFNSIFPQEKVYLQFDNTSYYTGETIWFKAFVVNASTLKRTESKVLYVDLLSPDGNLLRQQKLIIVAGQADGALTLLDVGTEQARDLRGITNYPSGFYEIRAYTNYMKNFSPDAFFSRVIPVFEKPKQEGNFYDEKPTITIKQSNTYSMRPETPKTKDINASFYPEGGHLIIGKPCRVAFKITGENGLGIDAQGVLTGSDITFNTLHDGMGVFTFTPDSRHNSVKITAGDETRSFSLPDAEKTGCTVQSAFTDKDRISFTILSSDDMAAGEYGMTLTCRGELVDFDKITLDGPEKEHTFDLNGIPEGVIRFTLFNKAGDILATRSFYNERADAGTPSISILSDKESYSPFEKIMLSFHLSDGNGNPFRDRFCLSVRDNRSQASVFNEDLRINFLLSSDLKGFIEKPAYYFNPDNQDRLRDLDLLCMVQGWERYDWRSMAGIDQFEETYRQEKEGLSLNGWILKSTGRKPLAHVEVNATLVPNDKTLTESYSYVTDDNGYFGFDIGAPFYDKARFSIKASPKDKNLRSAITIMFDRARTPSARAYLPGETVFYGRSYLSNSPQNSVKVADDGLPYVINIETGLILPEVDIEEHRKFIDYYTFNAYDVTKDVEKELDKGNYSTDVFSYLKEKGYEVRIGMLYESGQDFSRVPTRYDNKLLINGYYAYVYAHTETLFRDLEKESLEMGDSDDTRDDPSVIASTFDTRDIKSIMIYENPMRQTEAWDLSPLYMDNVSRLSNWSQIIGSDEDLDRTRNRAVYMIDILMKNSGDLVSRKDEFDRSRRVTTVDGYSRSYSFYGPEYPNGPIPGDVDYRRTLYWNPNVITDENGDAMVEFYNNSVSKHFDIEAAGITASGTPYTLDAGF